MSDAHAPLDFEPIALASTDIGRVKDANEDSFLVDKRLRLYVVADGMGGHAAGEVASDTAVTEIRRFITEREAVLQHFVNTGEGREAVLAMLEQAVRHAGACIYRLAEQDPSKRGMGTTTSLLLLTPTRGFVAHVGDSRVYLVRDGVVFQLTEDHSVINELKRRGKYDEATAGRYKNAMTRAVGVFPEVQVDTFDVDIASGDDFLLCSDGLTEYLKDEKEIVDVLRANEFLAVPQTFVELANARGGKDNITSLVVHLRGEGGDAELSLKVNTLRKMPIFQHLTYLELQAVMSLSKTLHVATGDVVFREGDAGNALYLVLEGRVRIEKDGIELALLGPGGHFGEMAIMDKGTRSADAVAAMDSRLLVVGRRPLFELMRKDKEVAVKLLWCFVQVLNLRLRATNEHLSAAKNEDLELQDLVEVIEEDA